MNSFRLLIGFLVILFTNTVLIAQQPVINSFTPLSGPAGTTIIITGTGFDPLPGNNIVYFGACSATVQSSATNSLTVTCPEGATYEAISVTTSGRTGFSSKPFLVTFPSGNTITPANLGPPISSLANTYPRHMIACDLDNNGKSEIIVVHTNAAIMSVFRNTSSLDNISFASRQDFVLPAANAMHVAKGDIDGDGKQDLLVANYNLNSITVFRNTSTTGSISFADGGTYLANTNPNSIAVADFDQDGKPDMAATNNNSNNISVHRNLSTPGNISFAAKITFSVGDWPQSIAAADIDGDGKSDLTATNYNAGTISVLRNTSTSGTISFNPKIDFSGGINPTFLAFGDLDGDEKPDMAFTNGGSQTVSVYKNNSSTGVISFNSRMDITTGTIPNGITMSDIDGDAKPDLLVGNFGSNTISILKNTGSSGTISFAPKIDFPTAGSTTRTVVAADIDGDSKPDLSTIKSIDNIITVYRNYAGEYTEVPACINSSITLTAEITGTSYIWEFRTIGGFWGSVFNGGNYSGANTRNLLISNIPASFHNYQYRCLVDVFNRTRVKLLNTYTVVTPAVAIQTPVTNICDGATVAISAASNFEGGSPTYQWQLNGINTGSNNPTFNSNTLRNGDQIRLLLTSSLSCASPATVVSNILAFTLELTTPIINGSNNTLTITNPEAGAIYVWEQQNAGGNWSPVVPAASGSSYTATTSGSYRTKGTKNSCVLNSNSINLTVTAVTNPDFDNVPIRFFPNPATNELWLDSLKLSDRWETLDVVGANGRHFLPQRNIKGLRKVLLTIESLPNGVYVLVLRRANGRFTSIKFVKI